MEIKIGGTYKLVAPKIYALNYGHGLVLNQSVTVTRIKGKYIEVYGEATVKARKETGEQFLHQWVHRSCLARKDAE